MKDELQQRLQLAESELEKKIASEERLQAELTQLEVSVREKTETIAVINKTADGDRVKYEERVLYLQMQLNALKAKEDAKDRELAALKQQVDQLTHTLQSLQHLAKDSEINAGDYKEVIRECHNRISSLESELARCKEREHELEKNAAYVTVLKAEQDAILASVKKDLKLAIAARDETIRRIKELEEYRMKAEFKLATLEEVSVAMDEAREALEEREARITRMQAEAQVAERNHALRTAMLATAEAHIESLKTDLAAREATAKEAIERVTVLQGRLSESEARLEERVAECNKQVESARKKADEDIAHSTMQMNAMREQHLEAVEQLKKEHAKKSATARTLIAEKDEEIRVLSGKVAELSEEIASGAHNERRIFELAKAQSAREATHNLRRFVSPLD